MSRVWRWTDAGCSWLDMKKIGKVVSKAGGVVYVDVNDNSVMDVWEARTITSNTGSFVIDAHKLALKGVLMHFGGLDVYSGTDNTIYYAAPDSAKVMNALTTITVQLQEDLADLAIAKKAASTSSSTSSKPDFKFAEFYTGASTTDPSEPSVTASAAAKKLLAVAGGKSFNLLKEDPYSALKFGQLKAGSVKQANALVALEADIKLELFLKLGTAVINSLSLAPPSQFAAQQGMVEAISSKIAQGGMVDLSQLTHLTHIADTIISGGIAAGLFTDGEAPFHHVNSMSAVIRELLIEVDLAINSVLSKGKSITSADIAGVLDDVALFASVASRAAVEIERAWYSQTELDVLEEYTGEGLQQLLAGKSTDVSQWFSEYVRDASSMTTGKDIWIIQSGGYSPVTEKLDKHDELLNFSLVDDKLKLPDKGIMAAGLYGELQVNSRGLVVNIVWYEEEEVGSGIRPISVEEAVNTLLAAMGDQVLTVAFHKNGDTYVVQGSGTSGEPDIMVKLTGVMVQELSSILV